MKLFLLFLFSLVFTVNQVPAQQAENALPVSDSLLYTLYMVGDAGDDTANSMPVLRLVEHELKKQNPTQSGMIFLGDNIYPDGLHKKNSKQRAEDELRINAQLNIVKDFDGDRIFLTGNHDWKKYDKGGKKAVLRQEKYISKYLDDKDILLPEKGCPGPEVVKLAPGLVMIIIDTQWWLHKHDRPSGLKDGCDCRNEAELIVLFKDALKKYRNQNIIVAAHHPLISNGEHGGHFTAKDHLFPLTKVADKAYLPLPVIGSIYPFYRKFIGHHQDIAHPVYQDMVNKLTKAIDEYDNIIYIAGHEHNLQYHQRKTMHHVISGSGSKSTHVVNNNKLEFGTEQKGYARLLYYESGAIWVEFFTAKQGNEHSVFRHKLFTREVIKNQDPGHVQKKSYKGMYATVVPDSSFAASDFKRVFMGDHNRDLWTQPLNVPYLNIHYEKGGLVPVKKGGGQQTISLRMLGADGKEYSLRGIKKNSRFLIERNLRGTVAQDVLYDGMSGSHPYASVAIPPLAKAAGVYHSNPKLVYVPKDSILGDYLEEFGGMFCLFEERPDGDMTGVEGFGDSKDVISYSDAIENLQSKYSHIVDKDYMITARLFDMAIGDWDRHDDQWRWATFKEGDFTVYRAIPRDRDQAFFEFNGAIPNIVNSKWLVRKFQPFDEDIRDIAGLCFNARYFDRAFLTEGAEEDWIRLARVLQQQLTDEVIEQAIRELPPEGFAISGEEIIATLKARRDRLPEFAAEYYAILSKTVSIHGTFKDDYFEVTRHENGSVELSVYPRDKKGKKVRNKRYFHRVFHPDETKEIRLYGLDGNDEYQLNGESRNSVLVRIIAGGEKDKIEDKSKVNGLKKHTLVYDVEGSRKLKTRNETRVLKRPETDAYDYDRRDFVYNKLMPLASVGYNGDDGFFIGPGFKLTVHGFKKKPYKFQHKLLTNFAEGIDGFNLYYDFDYPERIGKLDLAGSVRINLPETYQYYGSVLKPDYDDDQYNVLMNNYEYNLSLKMTSDDQAQSFRFGITAQHVNFDQVPTALLAGKQSQSQSFIAPSVRYHYKNVDNKVNPHRGIQFKAFAMWNNSIENDDVSYLKISSDLSLYVPLHLTRKQTTLALRSGFNGNFGDYTFYQAPYVDSRYNFRGVHRNRYAAESFFYQNIDLRQDLFRIRNYLVPFDVGLLGHIDVLHLWEVSIPVDNWMQSYGAGIYINILDAFMLKSTITFYEEEEMLLIGSKFLF